MANYVLVYRGGGGMAGTPEEQQQIMAAWGVWFNTLGQSLVDGGNPFGPSSTINSDGSSSQGGSSGLTGYTILKADNLDAATGMAKGCPVLTSGGSVEVYETHQVM
jgi:hypothetical protein